MSKQPPKTFSAVVGRRLRMARETKELSLRDVAGRLGLSHGAIGHWETGESPISLDNLARLAKLYDTTVVALVAQRLSNEDVAALVRRQLDDASHSAPGELEDA